VLDVGRVVAWLFAVASCRPPRFLLGWTAAAVVGALLAWEIAAPVAGHVFGRGGPGAAFALAFIGPSRLEPKPWLTIGEGAVAFAASRAAFDRARALRPESDAARAWDRAGLRFFFVAVTSALLVVFDALLAGLLRDA
jgi:hypothetical protein